MNDLAAFLVLAGARRSVRRFRAEPVPAPLLGALLEAAAWAPSAGNRQDWQFTVVTADDTKAAMARCVRERWAGLVAACDSEAVREELGRYAGNFDWFAAAPVVIAASTRGPETFLAHLLGVDAAPVAGARTSTAMAVQNLLLAAHAAGLGGCCLTGPVAAAAELRNLLGLDRRQELVCLVAIGYPAEQPAPPPRRPADDIVRRSP